MYLHVQIITVNHNIMIKCGLGHSYMLIRPATAAIVIIITIYRITKSPSF